MKHDFKTNLGDFYYATPEETKVRFYLYMALKKLGLQSCQHRVFLADDYSFLTVIK